MMDMFTIGLVFTAMDRMSNVVGEMCNKAVTDLGRIQDKLKAVSEQMMHLGKQATGAGLMITGALEKPLSAFKEYEQAQVSLKVAVMQEGGKIDIKQFEQLSRLADQLGKDYMGSTQDFYKMFRVLTEQGIPAQKILGGLGKTVADFAAVTGEGYTDAAFKIAKFHDSLGIPVEDMQKFADVASKAKFAFGLDTQEMYYALPYMAAGLKSLGLQGVEASRGVLKLMGVMAQAGVPASEIGTSLGQVINRMGDLEHTLERKKVMENIGPILDKYKIKLDFWDAQGKFAGIENMIKQFEKLNPLSDVEKIQAMKYLFGDVAGRSVAILGNMGLKGWAEAEEKMKRQSSLAERIAAIQETAAFKWDSLTGTIKNFAAAIGDVITKSAGLKFVMDKVNDAFGNMREWIMNHQKLAGAIGAVVDITGGALVIFGGAMLVLGMATKALSHGIGGIETFTKFIKMAIPLVRLKAKELWSLIWHHRILAAIEYRGGFWNAMQYWMMTTRYKIIEVVGAMKTWTVAQLAAFRANFLTIAGLQNMARAFGTTLLTGLRAAIAGLRAFSIALFTTPVGWISLAIAGAALLIYKFWGPISGFFRGLWSGLKEGLKGLEPAWDIFKKVASVFAPVIWPLRMIYNLVKMIIGPVNDTGKAAENLGVSRQGYRQHPERRDHAALQDVQRRCEYDQQPVPGHDVDDKQAC